MVKIAYNDIKAYYRLAKPGIVYGNLMPALAGFFLASQHHVNWAQLPWLIFGFVCVTGAACVFNNYMDREIDARMERTKNRALVIGKITPQHAYRYGSVLAAFGFATLITYTHFVTVLLALIGLVDYIFLYGYAKRHSVHGTLVGTIAGAVPPAIGYTAVTGHWDTGALILFLAMVFWQMPHFFAIAVYRLKDYKAAGIPVLPAVKSMFRTKVQVLLYMGSFTLSALSLTVFGYTGLVYALLVGALCSIWIYKAISGFETDDDSAWARGIFGFSLVVLMVFCASIAASPWLPF